MDLTIDKSNMKKKMNINLRESTQMILIFLAYGWFAYFCFQAYIDYRKEITGLNQFLTPVNELPLPAITVCSKEIFKNVSEDTTGNMILENMPNHFFTREDLFHETFMLEMWNPHEIFSPTLGLCTSIRAWNNVTDSSYNPFWIYLQAGKKYKVDFHHSSTIFDVSSEFILNSYTHHSALVLRPHFITRPSLDQLTLQILIIRGQKWIIV